MKRIVSMVLMFCLVFSCFPSVVLASRGCTHEYSQTLFEPTCVEEGFTMYLCRFCGKNYQDDFVPALGHDLEEFYIATGGCRSEYYEYCRRCEYIHDMSNPAHGYTYGGCWFCDRQEPDTIYKQIEQVINGEQVVLAYRSYALTTSFESLRVTVEESAVICPPMEAVWTMHRMGEGYVLRHRDKELRVGYDEPLELAPIGDGSLWSLVPTGEQGEYQFYCQEEDLYLCETTEGWSTSDRQTFGEKLRIYAYCDHEFLDPAVVQSATCFSEGILQRKCVKCSACYEEGIHMEPHCYENQVCIWCRKPATEEHIWSEAIKVTEATCTQGAKEYRRCTLCGEHTVIILSEPKEHFRELLYVREASCKGSGVEYHGCRCGQILYKEYLDSAEHNYGQWTEIRGQVCAYSVLESVCMDCGEDRQEAWYGPNHDFGKWQVKTLPTCTDSGSFYRQCRTCRHIEDHSMDALGHGFDRWKIVKEPTCAEEGEQFRKCKYCDHSEQEPLPATGHEWDQAVVSVEPTCTEEGEKSRKCKYCDQTEQETLPATGHEWDQGVVSVEPTWSQEGEMVFTCLHCGEQKSRILDAIGKDPCDGGEECWSRLFTDAPPAEDWAHEGIDFVIQMGLFNGMSEDTFSPHRTMTRGMLVTVLWRYAGSPLEGENTFTDVEEGLWYTDAIAWAAEKNIVTGVGNNRFNPRGIVTREQLATILYRFSRSMGPEMTEEADLKVFPDWETVSPWATEALAWAVGEELIKGVQHGEEAYLAPLGGATRAQVATILMRYIESFPFSG